MSSDILRVGIWGLGRRHRLSEDSPLFSTEPLRVTGVVNLAGPGNLENFLPLQSLACGDPVISSLIGGVPAEVPDRYRDASPSNLLPIGVKQFLIVGAQDKTVPPHAMKEYEEEAKRMGDDVELTVAENASHFEVIAPGSVAWATVEAAVRSILNFEIRQRMTENPKGK